MGHTTIVRLRRRDVVGWLLGEGRRDRSRGCQLGALGIEHRHVLAATGVMLDPLGLPARRPGSWGVIRVGRRAGGPGGTSDGSARTAPGVRLTSVGRSVQGHDELVGRAGRPAGPDGSAPPAACGRAPRMSLAVRRSGPAGGCFVRGSSGAPAQGAAPDGRCGCVLSRRVLGPNQLGRASGGRPAPWRVPGGQLEAGARADGVD